ncbi:MAG: InlB B-repeat-containing protein, partial [Alphaproteobacteria bacterium]|nr:InlB B-repeat-containing protein [Alphaproteobacteria bacterium]
TVETANNSIAQCPTTHPNSAEGAGADTQCYTACTVDMVAKATAVTGNDYYGSGVDTCGATACETGYHVDGGGLELVEKTPLAPISMTDYGAGYRYVNANGTSNSQSTVDAIPADSVTAPNTWAVAYSDGVVYGKASCQPASNDAAIAYVMSTYQSVLGGGMTIEAFKSGLEPIAGSVLTDYAADILLGLMKGTKTEKDMYEAVFVVFGTKKDANYSTDSVGEYCYCQMDGFMPNGGTEQIVISAPWVFVSDLGSADFCADYCAFRCADGLRSDGAYNLAFRAAVVGALEAVETGGICAANTINIDWNPDNNGAHTINQCTYEGSITVPADPVKPGYTFTGWKLVE